MPLPTPTHVPPTDLSLKKNACLDQKNQILPRRSFSFSLWRAIPNRIERFAELARSEKEEEKKERSGGRPQNWHATTEPAMTREETSAAAAARSRSCHNIKANAVSAT